MFFLLAWLTFDLFNRNETAASPARPASLFPALRKRRSRRAWAQALVWKDFNFIAFGMMPLVIKLVLYGAVSGLVVYMVHRDRRNSLWRGDEVGGTMMSIFLLIGILELALHAGRIFREEVKWRTLSDLMALPMPVAKIAYLSLWLKWGALAAAFGILVLGYMFCGTFVGLIFMAFSSATMGNGMFWNTLAVFGTILLLALSAVMHIHSGYRLVRLAAE